MLELPQWGNSNKYQKQLFYEEIHVITKQEVSYFSVGPLSIRYNSKFILMEMSLGTNAVIVTRVPCISECCWKCGSGVDPNQTPLSAVTQIWICNVYTGLSVPVLRLECGSSPFFHIYCWFPPTLVLYRNLLQRNCCCLFRIDSAISDILALACYI